MGSSMNHHALQRAMERYGLNLMAGDLHELAGRIERGESLLCERKPDGAETRLAKIGPSVCGSFGIRNGAR